MLSGWRTKGTEDQSRDGGWEKGVGDRKAELGTIKSSGLAADQKEEL